MRWQEWIWIHTRPPSDRFNDEHGTCNVCGKATRFLYSRWSMPQKLANDFHTEAVRAAYRRRESMWCASCGASARERGLWQVLIEHYGRDADSARGLVDGTSFRNLRVAEINRLNAGHRFLEAHPRLAYSEYPDEDIQALSYAMGSFDLVITSDTLEHVPDYRVALRETRRILVTGGRHILTVPLRPDLPASQNRTGLEPIHHGVPPGPLALLRRPTDDMLALHDFGWDFIDEVAAAGFQVELHGRGVESVICATAI